MEKGKNPLQIGSLNLASDLLLAPLAGYTDIGFRSLAVRFGAGLTYTEMVSTKALYYESERTENLLATADNESPKAVQLFGNVPEHFALAAQNPLLSKFDLIDINFGCPVKKIFGNGEGSALMRNIPLAAEIVTATKKHSGGRPVTVKTRVGVTDDTLVLDFAKAMEDAGADAITIHGRTRNQMYGGTVNLAAIERVKNSLKIPVIGNGDVRDEKSLAEMRGTGVDGIMIGRGGIGRPYLFSILAGEGVDYDLKECIRYHTFLLRGVYDDKTVADLMKKHLCAYAYGLPCSKDIKTAVNRTIGIDVILELTEKFF